MQQHLMVPVSSQHCTTDSHIIRFACHEFPILVVEFLWDEWFNPSEYNVGNSLPRLRITQIENTRINELLSINIRFKIPYFTANFQYDFSYTIKNWNL